MIKIVPLFQIALIAGMSI